MNVTAHAPTFSIQRNNDRYQASHGWLRSYHSFSFAEYYDAENLNWGALRVFNDDYIEAAQGFGTHPHRDMEILTYVLAGELEHRDSLGNTGVVKPGGVQFMSAGTGVQHSEFNHSKTEQLHLVQMWVLPGKLGERPRYGQQQFTIDDRRNQWLTVASGEPNVSAPIELTQRAIFRVARLEDHQLVHEFGKSRYGFLFVAEGEVAANGAKLAPGDAVRLFDIEQLTVAGSGEVVLWDVPAVKEAPHDA